MRAKAPSARSNKSREEEFYRAMLERDPSYEGVFIVGVKTTGIFCRSTCRARERRRENVEFFRNTEEAARAGYRACRVCKPTLSPVEDVPVFFRELSSKLYENPFHRITDGEIKKMGYIPATVRRWFNRKFKITFHAWQRMIRLNSAFQKLQKGQDVTGTAFDSGYESLSGFGESFKNTFGFPPSRRGPGRIVSARRIDTPIGPLFACAVDEGVCYLQFVDQRTLEKEIKDLCRLWKARMIHGNHRHLVLLEKQLSEYFTAKRRTFQIPLWTPGTEFQKKSWAELQKVPYGNTISYKEQARRLGAAQAIRAAGSANRKNRITIVIPCHRVMGSDGDLRGYAGGLWRKKWLIEFESRNSAAAISVKKESNPRSEAN